jgi:hypothetical protein
MTFTDRTFYTFVSFSTSFGETLRDLLKSVCRVTRASSICWRADTGLLGGASKQRRERKVTRSVTGGNPHE